MADTKVCARCTQRLPIEQFYFVSRASGTRRGQCKACMVEIKTMQKDPGWKPQCSRCGVERERIGPGRRLCEACFRETYDADAPAIARGSHRLRLKPCRSCGAERLREDHEHGTMLCAVCRSVSQSRRKRLLGLFNISPREYFALLEFQRQMCAICGRRFRSTPNIDHQHKSPSIVRGAVCGTCNSLLGLARDDPAVLLAAVAYLKDPPAQQLFPGRTAHEEANRRREPFRPLTRSRKGSQGTSQGV